MGRDLLKGDSFTEGRADPLSGNDWDGSNFGESKRESVRG